MYNIEYTRILSKVYIHVYIWYENPFMHMQMNKQANKLNTQHTWASIHPFGVISVCVQAQCVCICCILYIYHIVITLSSAQKDQSKIYSTLIHIESSNIDTHIQVQVIIIIIIMGGRSNTTDEHFSPSTFHSFDCNVGFFLWRSSISHFKTQQQMYINYCV